MIEKAGADPGSSGRSDGWARCCGLVMASILVLDNR